MHRVNPKVDSLAIIRVNFLQLNALFLVTCLELAKLTEQPNSIRQAKCEKWVGSSQPIFYMSLIFEIQLGQVAHRTDPY